MNCKPGTLAMVVNTRTEFNGWIVTCVEPTTDRWDGDPGWIVTPQLGKSRGVKDAHLKPILPPPGSVGDDEVESLYAPSELEIVR